MALVRGLGFFRRTVARMTRDSAGEVVAIFDGESGAEVQSIEFEVDLVAGVRSLSSIPAPCGAVESRCEAAAGTAMPSASTPGARPEA